MKHVGWLMVCCGMLSLVGCASTAPRSGSGLATANPLEVIAAPEPAFYRGCDGKLAVDGPTVIGTRGQGLNVATNVHRIFSAMGIPTEVTIADLGPLAPTRGVQTQVQIAFPDGLSPHEQTQVKRVLVLFRPRVVR